MITFTLNGKKIQEEEGQYVLEVAEKYGIEIPTLCHHPALEPAGMCRLCMVEVNDGRRTRYVTACNYPIREGMDVKTDTEAVHQGRKLIVELLLARCPRVPIIQQLAAKYDIKKPRFKAEDEDCILCGLCTRICEKMGNGAISLTGRGVELKVDTPFHVQTDVCMACGACAFICPTGHIKLEDITRHTIKPIPSEYDAGLKSRKPIYVPYAQAIPNTPAIDRDLCVHFKTGACKICADVCPANAMDYDQQDETVELEVGSIILAPGFKGFDPSGTDIYAYDSSPDVVTSLEFERILSATGPFEGHLIRPSDKRREKQPEKIAWIQCVGSRDINRCDNGYCSAVCCMYAVKQAVMARDHSTIPLDCAIFYMDMRTQGKDFDRYYENAKKDGIRFIRSRVHSIIPLHDSHDLLLRYVQDNGTVQEEVFNMVVLSTGIEIDQNSVRLAENVGIALDSDGFVRSKSFQPVATSVAGIYACGAFTGPKDIPQSVMEASAAASAATEILAPVRNSQTRTIKLPAEVDVTRQPPKIGVFVCNCGINIGGVVNVPEVAAYAKTLPFVQYVEENLFTCSQDTQVRMAKVIKEKSLNRVVVAACTPKTHEGLFQETLLNAGLNKYLFEMANIRNQDSWVHADDPEAATEKAKDLVRMAVAKSALLNPLQQIELPVTQSALVVGGGIAGMTVALSLAHQGYPVDLVEKADTLGGNAARINQTSSGERVADYLKNLVDDVNSNGQISVHLKTTVTKVEGFVGNFKTQIQNSSSTKIIEHGVAILATGAKEYQPQEYLYGRHDAVVTQLEMDQLLRSGDPRVKQATNAVFIQCVGSRNEEHLYCSKVCCTHAIQSALELKERNPQINVAILYRDIRTYGKREKLYRRARAKGILFFRYTLDKKPVVTADGARVRVEFREHIIDRKLAIHADILCLAAAIVSHDDRSLARFFKVPVDSDGWLLEAHQKLRPVDFATEGVFLCGMAHYPKPIEESIAQAKAAASRSITLLAKDKIQIGGVVTHIDPRLCSGCRGCINVCPYTAIDFNDESKTAEVNPALCKGCGACAAACPSEAAVLMGFSNNQLYAQIKNAFAA